MDTPAQTSETPRTDERQFDCLLDPIHAAFNREVVTVIFARQLERELNVTKAKLTAVLTDKDYEGGVQYWIRKHDELALILARLQSAESGHRAVRDAAAS